jgi:hypothetical protein
MGTICLGVGGYHGTRNRKSIRVGKSERDTDYRPIVPKILNQREEPKMDIVCCRNYHCRSYVEDNCTRSYSGEIITINERGRCEKFEIGANDFYKEQIDKEQTDKEQVETERYKQPLSPRAEEFIFQMAHKTELLEKQLIGEQNARIDEHEAWGMCQLDWERLNKENKTLMEKLRAAEKVAKKACEAIADTLGCCPYASIDDNEEISDALGCDDCETQLGDEDCWFKYFSLDLDEIGDVKNES